MNTRLALLAALLIAGSALWFFVLSHSWTDRITPGWEWSGNFIGTSTYADEETGEIPAIDGVSNYDRKVKAVPDSWQQGSVELEDLFILHDADTGEVTWAYTYRARVDPLTGRHLNPDFAGDYYVFPRNVQKISYPMRFSYFKGQALAFEAEENIEGLETYVFSYQGAGEYTESFAGSGEFEGVTVEPGQEIRCADDQLHVRFWVEPVTGEIVKTSESCHSGDAVYDIATQSLVRMILRWGGTISGDDVIRCVEQARAARLKYLWAKRYVPALLLAAGLLTLVAAWRRGAGSSGP